MHEWMIARELYDQCGRGKILLRLLFSRPWSLSSLVLWLYLALVAITPMLLLAILSGAWLAAAVIVMVVAYAALGGTVWDERARVVFPAHFQRHAELLNMHRARFRGLRFAQFLQRLEDAGRLQPAGLEAALRCCDAELELHRSQPLKARWPWIGLAVLVAGGLSLSLPWLSALGIPPLPVQITIVALGALAALLGSWFAAQPRSHPNAELRCFLVWALEEARSRSA